MRIPLVARFNLLRFYNFFLFAYWMMPMPRVLRWQIFPKVRNIPPLISVKPASMQLTPPAVLTISRSLWRQWLRIWVSPSAVPGIESRSATANSRSRAALYSNRNNASRQGQASCTDISLLNNFFRFRVAEGMQRSDRVPMRQINHRR